jgi:phosphoglycerol transferase MdoB-like AlkP superfamily enzyme
MSSLHNPDLNTLSTRQRKTARWLGIVILISLLAFIASSDDLSSLKIIAGGGKELSPEQLKRKPNVIVVLSEAFWDPTLLPNVKFGRDPLPFFHGLAEKYSSGWMLSPQFGGATANVEFEVLSSNSIRFLSDGVLAYENYVNTNVDSLASILTGQGYSAKVISAFHGYFANARKTYERFGFQRFISLEFFNPDEYEGPYMSDRAVTKRIIEETQKTDGPDFIYANTMENHHHYLPGKFKRNTIEVKADLPEDDIGILETYAQGINTADKMLETLVNYYNKLNEPTIIVFFGDHLPYFEEDYMVYKNAKYIGEDQSLEAWQKLHRTPLVTWNNFIKTPRDSLMINPSFLAPYLLHSAGLKGTDYTDFLYTLSQKIPVIPPLDYYEAYHIQESDLYEYEERQAAMLNGELTDQSERTMEQGYGIPHIRDISPNELTAGETPRTEAGRTLTVKGGRFGLGSVLFWNDQPVKTEWRNEDTITGFIPKELYEKPGTAILQVKVLDDQEGVVLESPVRQMPIVSK